MQLVASDARPPVENCPDGQALQVNDASRYWLGSHSTPHFWSLSLKVMFALSHSALVQPEALHSTHPPFGTI